MHGRCIEAATRYSLQLIAVAAVAAAVGVSLNGQPFPGACLAVLVALMTAPASTVDDGLLAGVLQIAAVYLASPTIELEPAPTARWTFIGGLVLVPLMARSSKPGPLKGISAPTAYRHWVAMAVALAILPLSLLNTAYSLLGRYGQAVAFLTPGAVLGATLRLAGRRGVGDDPTPLWGDTGRMAFADSGSARSFSAIEARSGRMAWQLGTRLIAGRRWVRTERGDRGWRADTWSEGPDRRS